MNEPRSYRVTAIVLRHTDTGEADRLLTLYTRETGKIRVLAKGARKIRSRKAGHLEPFTQVHLQLARSRDLPIVTQVETVDAYLPLRDNLMLTGYGAYLIELLDRITYDEEGAHPPIFNLLADSLSRLSTGVDPWLVVRNYEMRLLDFSGFRPQLFECANCSAEILPENQYISFSAGGVICPRCGMGLPGLREVSMDALKYLRHFQRSNFTQVLRAQPGPETKREVEALMQAYFTYLLERELKTTGFLKRLKADESARLLEKTREERGF